MNKNKGVFYMDDKFKATKKAGIYGIIGNIFLLIIKAIVGFVRANL